MTVQYQRGGGGVIVAPDGAVLPFPASISGSDLVAKILQFLSDHTSAVSPVNVVVDMNTVTNLQQLVDTVQNNANAAQTAVANIQSNLAAAQTAIQTINGRIATMQADIAAIKTKIGL